LTKRACLVGKEVSNDAHSHRTLDRALNYFLSREIERERQEVEAARRTEAANDPEYRNASG
jgi:hypothetical protein